MYTHVGWMVIEKNIVIVLVMLYIIGNVDTRYNNTASICWIHEAHLPMHLPYSTYLGMHAHTTRVHRTCTAVDLQLYLPL